jgi:hypothetical protein
MAVIFIYNDLAGQRPRAFLLEHYGVLYFFLTTEGLHRRSFLSVLITGQFAGSFLISTEKNEIVRSATAC